MEQKQQELERKCRVCFEQQLNIKDPLISPCHCSGGIQWIHRSCLNLWRSTKTNASFSRCEICLFEYEVVIFMASPGQQRLNLLRYYAYVIRDIVVSLLLFESIVALLTVILCGLDSQHHLPEYIGLNLSMQYLGAYIIWGHIFILFLIGCVTLCISLCNSSSQNNSTTFIYCDDMNCCTSTRSSEEIVFMQICCVILVCFIALFGAIVGVCLACHYCTKRFNRHREILWKKQEIERLIVKDLSQEQYNI